MSLEGLEGGAQRWASFGALSEARGVVVVVLSEGLDLETCEPQ